MKRLFIWFLLLNKRLYKKKTFLLLLALIPVIVISLSVAAKQESGFVTVSLAKEGTDKLADTIINELKDDSKIIRFVVEDSPQNALESVKTGRSDSAWIFNKNLEEAMENFVKNSSSQNAFVKVYEREYTVPLRISHEKLSGILYKYCAQNIYIQFVRTSAKELDNLSDGQIMSYYENFEMQGEIFEFAYPKGSKASNNIKQMNYIMSPIRGLLSVIAVLCGLAAALFSIEDDKKGVFSLVKQSRRSLAVFGCILIAVLNVSAVMFVSIFAVSVNVGVLREILALLVFVVCSTVFCMLVKTLFNSIKLLASLTPLFAVLMVSICPVFFDLKSVRVFQYLFPPTYYINGCFGNEYLMYGVLYSLSGLALVYILKKTKKAVV